MARNRVLCTGHGAALSHVAGACGQDSRPRSAAERRRRTIMMFRMVAKRRFTSISGSDGDDWQMLIQDLNSKTTTVNIKNHQRIQDLKNEIYLKGGIPPEYNTRLPNSKELHNDQDLEEAGLCPGCLLAVTTKRKEGEHRSHSWGFGASQPLPPCPSVSRIRGERLTTPTQRALAQRGLPRRGLAGFVSTTWRAVFTSWDEKAPQLARMRLHHRMAVMAVRAP